MSRCELTQKKPVVVNLVSHSNIKTKSKSQPNIQKKRIFSQALGGFVTLNVAASTLKSMEHRGGFDPFILNQPAEALSTRAKAVKKRIVTKLKGGSKKSTKAKAGAN